MRLDIDEPEPGRWLATRSRPSLPRSSQTGRDAWHPWAPRSIGELIGRLTRQQALITVVCTAPAPAAQVAEMIAARAVRRPGAAGRAADGLGVEPDDPALTKALDWLAARALAWPDGDGVRAMPELIDQFPHPHRLGPPMAEVYAALTVPSGARQVAELGGEPGRKLLDGSRSASRRPTGEPSAALVASRPDRPAHLLERVAWPGPVAARPARTRTSPRHRGGLGDRARPARALGQWQAAPTMPAEIALALRGPGWRPAFTPHPPPVAVQVRDPSRSGANRPRRRSTALERAGGCWPSAPPRRYHAAQGRRRGAPGNSSGWPR